MASVWESAGLMRMEVSTLTSTRETNTTGNIGISNRDKDGYEDAAANII